MGLQEHNTYQNILDRGWFLSVENARRVTRELRITQLPAHLRETYRAMQRGMLVPPERAKEVLALVPVSDDGCEACLI